ncbi:MAG TPA: SRPBCC family protein [Polyangiaceae bacterium]|nr:SRPBCC family protein [Polyangiaceae bacterium]
MSKATVEHATVTVERRLRAAPARVFSAWADPEQRKQWDVPSKDWVITLHEQDFRVGGGEVSQFGPKGDAYLRSEGTYLEILQDRRIISAGIMQARGTRMTATLNTVELLPDGDGTKLLLTDQSAFFGDEKPSDRQAGWNEIADKLERFLKS